METKYCRDCGCSFGCGRADPHCWCNALPALPTAALDTAGGCYCASCLTAHISAAMTVAPARDGVATDESDDRR